MDPDTDVCQTEQPQISYSVDFIAEQSSAMGSPNLLDREGNWHPETDACKSTRPKTCQNTTFMQCKGCVAACFGTR